MPPRLLLLLLLLLSALVVTSHAAASGPAAPLPTHTQLLRVPLENYDQMQFFGKVRVGTPPQEFNVIFDTGSSDIWLPEATCSVCAGKRRYAAAASTSHENIDTSFELAYGSGNATGHMMRETLAIGRRLTLARVRMGRVTHTSQRLQRFEADGIVGLGLEALATITTPSLFAAAAAASTNNNSSDYGVHALLARFSVYVNPLPGHVPSSQLLFGGVDESLVQRTSDNANTTMQWHYFPVVPFPDRRAFGFWSLELRDIAVLPLQPSRRPIQTVDTSTDRVVVARDAIAIVDSGTSVLLLPLRVFDRTLTQLQHHLTKHHARTLTPRAGAVSGVVCVRCSPEMFPPLAFAFALPSDSSKAKTLLLQGVDYVRCDGDVCAPQLDRHVLFLSSQGPDDDDVDVIVLGAIFLRAYYALFDVHAQRVGFACGDSGACHGGRNPLLQFHAEWRSEAVAAIARQRWLRLWLATIAMLLLLLLVAALLWNASLGIKSSGNQASTPAVDVWKANATTPDSATAAGRCKSPRVRSSSSDSNAQRLIDDKQWHWRVDVDGTTADKCEPQCEPPPPPLERSQCVSWRKSASVDG